MGAELPRTIRMGPALLAALLVVGALAACAAPAANPAAAPPKPAAAAASAAAPAGAGAAAPAPAPTGQAEWDQLVAAARREGKLDLAGPNTTFGRQALLEFQKDYPD